MTWPAEPQSLPEPGRCPRGYRPDSGYACGQPGDPAEPYGFCPRHGAQFRANEDELAGWAQVSGRQNTPN